MKNLTNTILFFIIITQIHAQLLVNQSNGYVSIGHLNDPLDELDIMGDIRLRADADGDQAAYRLYDHNNNHVFNLILKNSTPNAPVMLHSKDNRSLLMVGNKVQIANSSSSTPKFTYDANGRVGIGIDNPAVELDLVGKMRMHDNNPIQWYTGNTYVGGIQHTNEDLIVRNADNSGDILLRSDRGVRMETLDLVADSYKDRFVITNSGKIGIGTANPLHELHLVGDFGITGGVYGVSDVRLKKNIKNIESATEVLQKLRPVEYDFKMREFVEMNLPNKHQYGLIAQEVEKVLPELVSDHAKLSSDAEANVLKGINYDQIIPFLVKAIQEQQEEIDNLKTRINRISSK